MRTASLVGILLIILGIVAFVYGGFSYTKRERVLDMGPIHATAEERHTVPIPRILGGIALVGGIVLLVAGTRKSAV